MISVLIDIVLLLIIALCAYKGYRKGLILGISGILAIVISLYGANLIAETYSPEFTDVIQPFVSGIVYKSVDEAEEKTQEKDYVYVGPEEGEDDETYAVSYESLRNIGILKTAAERITDDVRGNVSKVGHELKEALSEKLTSTAAYVLTLVISFILIMIIFTVIANIVNLAFKLPGLEFLNEILGLAFGLCKGLIFAFAIAWVVRFLGFIIPEEIIDRTLLLDWFIEMNPIPAILGI